MYGKHGIEMSSNNDWVLPKMFKGCDDIANGIPDRSQVQTTQFVTEYLRSFRLTKRRSRNHGDAYLIGFDLRLVLRNELKRALDARVPKNAYGWAHLLHFNCDGFGFDLRPRRHKADDLVFAGRDRVVIFVPVIPGHLESPDSLWRDRFGTLDLRHEKHGL